MPINGNKFACNEPHHTSMEQLAHHPKLHTTLQNKMFNIDFNLFSLAENAIVSVGSKGKNHLKDLSKIYVKDKNP